MLAADGSPTDSQAGSGDPGDAESGSHPPSATDAPVRVLIADDEALV
ncbi:hypothetical protein [Candidatus Frankia alpina]|nr:hypothetical protein [Candidatus Frankia alpina]